jgi:hypothetical protein
MGRLKQKGYLRSFPHLSPPLCHQPPLLPCPLSEHCDKSDKSPPTWAVVITPHNVRRLKMSSDGSEAAPAPSPAAERMRRHRKRGREAKQRQANEMHDVQVALHVKEVEMLVQTGFLKEEDRHDPEELRKRHQGSHLLGGAGPRPDRSPQGHRLP